MVDEHPVIATPIVWYLMRRDEFQRVTPACSNVTFVGEEAHSLAIRLCLALVGLMGLLLAVISFGAQVLSPAVGDLAGLLLQWSHPTAAN